MKSNLIFLNCKLNFSHHRITDLTSLEQISLSIKKITEKPVDSLLQQSAHKCKKIRVIEEQFPIKRMGLSYIFPSAEISAKSI